MRVFCNCSDRVDAGVHGAEVYVMQHTSLFYIRGLGDHLQGLQLKALRHINVVKQALHFWRKGVLLNCFLARMCNDAAGKIEPTNPRWTNQMSDVPRLLLNKLVC